MTHREALSSKLLLSTFERKWKYYFDSETNLYVTQLPTLETFLIHEFKYRYIWYFYERGLEFYPEFVENI